MEEHNQCGCPIVGLTGGADEETVIAARESGMVQVLTKPIGKKELSQCISRYISSVHSG